MVTTCNYEARKFGVRSAMPGFKARDLCPENGELGRFRNFISYRRNWLEETGSEDSHGRALWALGTCVGRSPRDGVRAWAAEVFEKALPAVKGFTSPRAWAFAIIGLHEYLRTLGGDLMANQFREELVQRLYSLYKTNASPDWLWFEQSVTYENAHGPLGESLRSS